MPTTKASQAPAAQAGCYPDAERLARLALARVRGLGAIRQAVLLDHFGSAEAVFACGRADLERAGVPGTVARALDQAPWRLARSDLQWGREPGNGIVLLGEPGYPDALAHIPDPPTVLFLQGVAGTLALPAVAVVGARRSTPGGRRLAGRIAAGLAAAGWTVVSGLALGIDAAAHEGALAGHGTTIAVLGCGAGRIYPARHAGLGRRIVEQGAVISEFPPGTPVHPAQFPRRNRIVSGLSRAVVVVEAGRRSGSLITARLALDQGRDVMAVPGSPANPLATGANWLLREGARLVVDAADVLDEIEPNACHRATPAADGKALVTSAERSVADALRHAPADADELAAQVGLSAAEVRATLVALELKGVAARVAGGLWGHA